MLKIGILSDSHRKTNLHKEAIAKLKSEGAQYLLHLGDLCVEDNLKALKDASLPYAAVFGNNDIGLMGLESIYKIEKEPYYLKIKDIKIKMMHLPYFMSADCDIVLFGHTHMHSCEFKNGTLFLNPGEVCARNKNLTECAIINVNSEKFIVNYYFKEPTAKEWQEKIYNYKRV